MSRLRSLLPWLVLLWGGLTLASCSLPGLSTPTPFVFPTPDLTLTAVANSTAIPPTATKEPTSPTTAAPTPTPGDTPTTPPSATPTSLPPTNTPLPTATFTPTPIPPTPTPARRPGPVVRAPLLWVAPNHIDGNFVDWRTRTTYPIKYVVYGQANYNGPSDISGKYRIGWDYRALYIGVEVTDDHLVQTQHGKDIFKGDEIEIQLDTNLYGDFYIRGLNIDDYQIGVSPGSPPGTSPEAYVWYPAHKAGKTPSVDIGVQLEDHGYNIEFAIPWAMLGFKPHIGMQMGFAINISDNDNAGKAEQQTMISNDPYRALADPTTWGTLVLYNPGK